MFIWRLWCSVFLRHQTCFRLFEHRQQQQEEEEVVEEKRGEEMGGGTAWPVCFFTRFFTADARMDRASSMVLLMKCQLAKC